MLGLHTSSGHHIIVEAVFLIDMCVSLRFQKNSIVVCNDQLVGRVRHAMLHYVARLDHTAIECVHGGDPYCVWIVLKSVSLLQFRHFPLFQQTADTIVVDADVESMFTWNFTKETAPTGLFKDISISVYRVQLDS